jgi:hypothetical protein
MVIHPKKFLAYLKVKSENSHQMGNMLALAQKRILAQGPAILKDYGPVYVHPKTQARDPIAILLPHAKPSKWHFSVISSEINRRVVRYAARTYLVNIELDNEKDRFTSFLQALQDAHDYAFCYDKNVADRRKLFAGKCEIIKKEFKL